MPRQAPLTAENNLLVPKQAAFLCHFSNLSFEHTSLNLSDSLPFSIIPFSFFFKTESTVENGACSENLQVPFLSLSPFSSFPFFYSFLGLFLVLVSLPVALLRLESEYDGRKYLAPGRESRCPLDVGLGLRTVIVPCPLSPCISRLCLRFLFQRQSLPVFVPPAGSILV